MLKVVILTLVSTIVFGLIDGSFFLFAEEKIQKPIRELKFFDRTSSELFTGGISSAAAIMASSIFQALIKKYTKTDIKPAPILDAIGIMIGTMIVVLLYKMFSSNDGENKDNKDNKNKDNKIIDNKNKDNK